MGAWRSQGNNNQWFLGLKSNLFKGLLRWNMPFSLSAVMELINVSWRIIKRLFKRSKTLVDLSAFWKCNISHSHVACVRMCCSAYQDAYLLCLICAPDHWAPSFVFFLLRSMFFCDVRRCVMWSCVSKLCTTADTSPLHTENIQGHSRFSVPQTHAAMSLEMLVLYDTRRSL